MLCELSVEMGGLESGVECAGCGDGRMEMGRWEVWLKSRIEKA